MSLETRRLNLGYDNKCIISQLDLTIPSSQITVLVGPNGCGKSTLLRGLARLLKPDAGNVYLDGADLFKKSTQEVAKRMGILSQGSVAPEDLTVRDLVAMGRYPHKHWWEGRSKEDERLTEWALSTTGLLKMADTPLDNLSGGQRQRAWIAMTLAQETSILLLDEPTTFLDLAHQVEVLELLWELNRSQGRTIVMVLHDLNQACRYADYLVMLRDGKVFAKGTPKKLMTEAMLLSVFGLECCIINDPVAGTPMCVPRLPHRLGADIETNHQSLD